MEEAAPAPAPAPESRPKRERKQVERLTIASPEKKKFVIEQGAGSALGDIDNIAFRLEARTRKDKMLKSLHRLLFRTAPKELTLKADIRKFSGFTYAADKKGAERAKDEAKLKDWFNDALGDLGELLDLHAPRSGTKDAKIKAILDFLEAPRQREGASSLREKKSKEVAKKKRKAERTAKAKEKKKAKAAKAAPKKQAAAADNDEDDDEEEEEDVVEGPSNKELRKAIASFMEGADLTQLTMKLVKRHLADKFGDALDIGARKGFIKATVVEVQDELEEDDKPLR